MSNATDPFYYPPDSPELRALAVRGFTIHLSVWLCAVALVIASSAIPSVEWGVELLLFLCQCCRPTG